MLSLSRFTSLVALREIENTQLHPNATAFRPMRITKDESGGPAVQLISTTSGLALGPSDGWLWTGASDKYITVGWIVRDFGSDYQKPEKDDPLQVRPAPRVVISNLAAASLELVWFDDHRAKIIGSRPTSSNGSFDVIAPNTDGTGFGKSIAFLIQPVGWTANTTFEALPNAADRIGQIVVSPLWQGTVWHDEHPEVNHGIDLTFTAVTKPGIPQQERTNYRYIWDFGDSYGDQGLGHDVVTHNYRTASYNPQWLKVTLLIKDQQGNRVSGDIVYVWVH